LNDLDPIHAGWTRDRLASARDGNAEHLLATPTRSGPAVRLSQSQGLSCDSISPDGKRIVLHQGDPTTARQSLTIVPIESGPGEPIKSGPTKEFLGGPFLKANGRISPDGKWIAYSTNESGTFEIYVQPFPDGGSRVQVSANGGNLAVWSPTKREIYFTAGGVGRMMVASYAINNGVFMPDKPQPWSQVAFRGATHGDIWGRPSTSIPMGTLRGGGPAC
jgi:Tol biopolymer transport system component